MWLHGFLSAAALFLMLCVSQCTGSCVPCELAICGRPECYETQQVLDPVCGCCPVCTRRQFERCGGDSAGVCAPGLTCRYRPGNILGKDRTGMCEPDTKVCKWTQCPYRYFCVGPILAEGSPELLQQNNSAYADETFDTPKERELGNCISLRFFSIYQRAWFCFKKNNTLCGNNGVTYPSHCHLQRAESRQKRFIGINHMGQCKPYTAKPAVIRENHLVGLKKSLLDNRPPIDPSSNYSKFYVKLESPSCTYNGVKYPPFSIIPIPNDVCNFLVCNTEGVLYNAPVLGCGDNAPEENYHVDRPPIHGGWSHWSGWTPCEGGCYNSSHSRYRTCTHPLPQNEGEICQRASKQTRRCVPERCNVTCDYTQWTPWTACSVTCGDGTSTRTRNITNEPNEETRKACHLKETKQCRLVKNCPIHSGPCKKRTLGRSSENFNYLPVRKFRRSCWTTNKYEVSYCGGDCHGNNGTDCCKPVRWEYIKFKMINCGYIWNRLSDVPIVAECGCVGEGEDAPLPFQDGYDDKIL